MINKEEQRHRRHKHIRKKLRVGFGNLHRLVIHKSNKRVYVSLVDDAKSLVLTGVAKAKKEAEAAGVEISEKAKKLGIERVVFDRAGYKYHGIVKRVAEGARKGGLKF